MDTNLYIFLFFQLIFSTVSQECEPNDGKRQSPININTFELNYRFAPKLEFSAGYGKPKNCNLTNTGHSFNLVIASKCAPTLSGGVTKAKYTYSQLHFHWGNNSKVGSEHTFDGRSYPMEMHVVHQQTTNDEIDSFVVIGFVFEISPNDNPGLKPIVNALPAAPHEHDSAEVPNFVLSDLIDTSLRNYLTYEGSLTTPPFTESVQWILSTKVLKISENQLKAFRNAAQLEHHMINNYRCVQPLNGRKVSFITSLY